MKKRVAVIIERANVALGGAERSVLELAAALSGLGLEVDVLAAKGRTGADNVHILCRNQPGKRVGFFNFEKALKRHLAQKSYDIVHSVLPFEFADVYQPRGGAYAESILRNAASYENRFIEYFKRYTGFTNWRRTTLLHSERKLSQSGEGPTIAALSRYVTEQFKQCYGTSERRIVTISNGIKTGRPINKHQADKLRTQILAKLRISESDDPVLFLFVANNFRLKGLTPLIKAMTVATQFNRQWKGYLVVVGSGKKLKYAELAEKLRDPTMGKRIVFLGPVSQVQNVLSIADVAALPTFYDPCSRFILEALAAGKPVITTKYNGATDLFVNNRHGKVIDTPGEVKALAEALSYFADTGNIECAARAIKTDNLEKNVSVSRAAGELNELYEEIMDKRGRV